MVDDTLCPKGDNEYHKLVCLRRECSECGVQAVNFSISELNDNGNNDSVKCKWSKYEYITLEGCENADDTPMKKLSIVNKEISPSELVNYLKQLLQNYPYHQFMSCWQKSQFDSLKENLPIDNVCVFMTTQKTMNAVIKKRFKVSTSVKLKHPFMLLFSTDMLHRNLTIVLVQRNNQGSSKSIHSPREIISTVCDFPYKIIEKCFQ